MVVSPTIAVKAKLKLVSASSESYLTILCDDRTHVFGTGHNAQFMHIRHAVCFALLIANVDNNFVLFSSPRPTSIS